MRRWAKSHRVEREGKQAPLQRGGKEREPSKEPKTGWGRWLRRWAEEEGREAAKGSAENKQALGAVGDEGAAEGGRRVGRGMKLLDLDDEILHELASCNRSVKRQLCSCVSC